MPSLIHIHRMANPALSMVNHNHQTPRSYPFKKINLYRQYTTHKDLKIKKPKIPPLMVKNSDGTYRPRSTSIFKRMQMERWRMQNAAANALAESSGFQHAWEYKMSIIIVRPVVLVPEPEPWEVEYANWKHEWEAPIRAQIPDIRPLFEEEISKNPSEKAQSHRSSRHESKRIQELRMSEDQDSTHEHVASRYTKADLGNDTSSLRRRLDQKLYFIVKDNMETHPCSWKFPQCTLPLDYNEQSPQLRSIAEIGANRALGSNAKLFMTGNSPCGFYNFVFPPECQQAKNTYGLKLFFYRGYYIQGNVQRNPSYIDHAWVTKEELGEYLQEPAFFKYLDHILI